MNKYIINTVGKRWESRIDRVLFSIYKTDHRNLCIAPPPVTLAPPSICSEFQEQATTSRNPYSSSLLWLTLINGFSYFFWISWQVEVGVISLEIADGAIPTCHAEPLDEQVCGEGREYLSEARVNPWGRMLSVPNERHLGSEWWWGKRVNFCDFRPEFPF
jgi:hypothetical protein